MRDLKKSYLTVTAGVVIMFLLGAAYIWGVYITPLSQHFGWSRKTVSMPFSVFLICYTAGMIIGGRLVDKFDARKISTIGSALFGLGYLFSGFARTILSFCLTYGVISGFGTGLAYVTSVVAANKCFPHKKGLVSGIIIFGFGAGAFLLAPLTKSIINSFNYQTAFITLGAVFTLITLMASQFIYIPPQTTESSATIVDTKVKNFLPSELFSYPLFYAAWAVWFLNLSSGLGAMGHIVPFAEKNGMSAIKAAFLLSIIALSNGAGRVIMGTLSDKIGRIKTLTFAAALMTAVSWGFANINSLISSTDITKMYILSIFFGIAFGTFLVLYPTTTAELFGTKYLGTNYGILFSSYGAGGLLGPFIFGRIYDKTLNYKSAFTLSVVMSLAGFIIALYLLSKTRKPTK